MATIPHESTKDVVMPFGKHKGRSIYDLATCGEMSYIRWLAEEISDPLIRDAARAVLEGIPVPLPTVVIKVESGENCGKPGQIGVFFPYTRELIPLMHQYKGMFDARTKGWFFSIANIPELLEVFTDLKAFKTELEVSAAAQKLLNAPAPAIITLLGAHGRVEKADSTVIEKLDAALKVWVEGAEFSPKYRKGDWDGFYHFFSRDRGTFPIGFLNDVKKVFTLNAVETEVVDRRQATSNLPLTWNGVELRYYQKDAADEALKRGMGFITLPTGSGKTEIAMWIMFILKKTTLVVVFKKALLDQWQKRLEKTFKIEVGRIGAGDYIEKDITVAISNTLYAKPTRNSYDILIVDEGHHIPADQAFTIAKRSDAKYRYCLSATPKREDGKEMWLWAFCGPLISPVDIERLAAEHYIASPTFRVLLPSNSINWKDRKAELYSRGKEYTWTVELDWLEDDETRCNDIIAEAKKLYSEGEKLYIDVRHVVFGKKLRAMLEKIGVPAVFISGNTADKEREKTLEAFETDEFILVSTLIKEGVDLPSMSAIILAGNYKSFVSNVQIIGRALRPKSRAIIIDIWDMAIFCMEWFIYRQNCFKEYYKGLYKVEEL